MPTCKKCGEEFETGPEVGVHAREAHSKLIEKPFNCGNCGEVHELPSYWSPEVAPPPDHESHPLYRMCKPCWESTWLTLS